MRSRKTWIFGAMLCGALLCGANSQAGTINFLSTGEFASSLTPTYTNGSTTVDYTALASTATVPPTNNVSLGGFVTASGAAPATPTTVSDTFTLTVTNTDTLDSISFTGTMSGAISSSTSNAFVLFSSPLSQTLDGFVFTIVSSDQGTPGRLNLNAPTTNGGISTINGTVSVTAVPEPASVALLAMAVPALAGLAYRRVRR
jgi:hypothetical protein